MFNSKNWSSAVAYARSLPSDWEITKWTDLPQDRFESFSERRPSVAFQCRSGNVLIASRKYKVDLPTGLAIK